MQSTWQSMSYQKVQPVSAAVTGPIYLGMTSDGTQEVFSLPSVLHLPRNHIKTKDASEIDLDPDSTSRRTGVCREK